MQSWNRVVGTVVFACLFAACGTTGPLVEQRLDAATGGDGNALNGANHSLPR